MDLLSKFSQLVRFLKEQGRILRPWFHAICSRKMAEFHVPWTAIYNPRQKSWHACALSQYLSWKFISSPPSPQFNVVYRDEVAIARFQHCQGGRWLRIPVMPLLIVSKIACQRMFQLSNPGVARTFVEDCICVTRRDYDMFSGKIRKRLPVLFDFVMALTSAAQLMF